MRGVNRSVPHPSREDIAAVVVLFNPSPEQVDNVRTYIGQVARVIAADNTPSPDATLLAQLAEMGVMVLPMGGNRGIATALNAGCDAAIAGGFEWALTLDQDSTPAPDMVEKLASCVGDAATGDVMLVAPVWQIEGGLEEELSEGCAEIDFAMTSGNLLRLETYTALDRFRDDLFIDSVDTEFCLRGRTRGFRILQRRDAVLLHRMGILEEKRFPFRHFVTNYSAARRYYMMRNALELNRLYGAQFPEWVAGERRQWGRDLPKILLSERDKMSKLRHIIRGLQDYRARRFGSYEEARSQSIG
jgi:rhamnosyltransferase